ncbi:Retrovirus-related Pol polyprotein from transposon [Trichinella pseudospiralis]
MGNGNLEEWRGSLVDRAECSQQDDTLDALPRLKWFSTLDLASGSASCTSRLDREEDTATMQVTGTRGQPMDEESMRPARHNSPAGEDYMSLVGDP